MKEMELGINIDFLKNQFKNIQEMYNMTWEDLDEYGGSLINDKIKIDLFTDRYEEGLSTNLRNIAKKENYFISDFGRIKGFKTNDDFLTKEEQAYGMSLSINHCMIYYTKILLERYCQDVLSGDFSQVGPGEGDD